MNIRRLISTGLVIFAVLSGTLMLSSGSALALVGHVLLPRTLGPFAGPVSVAVDNSTSSADPSAGDIYIADTGANSKAGAVLKFDSSGNPVSAGPLGSFPFVFVIAEGGGVDDVAVDPTTGEVYVSDLDGNVYKFDSSGNPISGGNFPLKASGEDGPPEGIAVDPSNGDLFVLDSEFVLEYDPAGALIKKISPFHSLVSPENLSSNPAPENPVDAVVDMASDLYVFGETSFGVVTSVYTDDKYDSSAVVSLINSYSSTRGDRGGIAVDSATSNFYAYTGNNGEIDEYDPSGSLFYRFDVGQFRGVNSLAVNDATLGGDIYAADKNNRVDIFGPVVLPDVAAGAPTSLQPNSVTLNDTVGPDGTHGGGDVSSIQFKYGLVSGQLGSTITSLPSECSSAVTSCAVSAGLTGLEANTVYYYKLVASNSNGTNETLERTFTTPPGPPVVQEQSASDLGAFSATLHGVVNPEHAPAGTTSYHFVYGLTSAYGQTFIPDLDAGNGSTGVAVTEGLSELVPGSTYHYALVATNEIGSTIGPDATFTTLPASPPTVSTGGVSGVTQYAATISGTLDSQGLTTNYHFDMGSDTNYGAQVFGSPVVFTGETPVELALQDLQPGTTYHYRLVAINAAGAAYGADETFTTPRIAPVIFQPVAPPLIATPGIIFPREARVTTPKGALTHAQKLAKALKACKVMQKKKRAACETQAKKRYKQVKQTNTGKKR